MGLGVAANHCRAPWLACGQAGGAVAGWIAAFVVASVIGLVLVSIYGLMMGALRERARGLAAPRGAHVFADLAIVAIQAVALR